MDYGCIFFILGLSITSVKPALGHVGHVGHAGPSDPGRGRWAGRPGTRRSRKASRRKRKSSAGRPPVAWVNLAPSP